MGFEVYTSEKLHKLIKSRQRLTNKKVRSRHIKVMKTLDLIRSRENKTYKLSTHGKTIFGFKIEERLKKRYLFNKEKVLYLTLLSEKARKQILLFLESLDVRKMSPRNSVIIDFHKRAVDELDIWPKETIVKGLQMYLTNKHIHRSFENRFRCMEMWLIDLGLVTKRSGKVGITNKGMIFKKKLRQTDLINLHESTELISGEKIEVLNVNSSVSYKLLKKKFLEKYDTLLEPTEFVDIQAMYEVVSIELGLENNTFFLKSDLPILLNKFWQEDLISSISNDTNGTLRYVVLKP